MPIFSALAQEKCGCGDPLPDMSFALVAEEALSIDIWVEGRTITLTPCAFKSFYSLAAFFAERFTEWSNSMITTGASPEHWDEEPKVVETSSPCVREEPSSRAVDTFPLHELPPHVVQDDEVLRRFGRYMVIAQIVDSGVDTEEVASALLSSGLALVSRISEMDLHNE